MDKGNTETQNTYKCRIKNVPQIEIFLALFEKLVVMGPSKQLRYWRLFRFVGVKVVKRQEQLNSQIYIHLVIGNKINNEQHKT